MPYPHLREKAFSLSPLNMTLVVGFLFLDFSYHIKEVPLYFLFAKEFIMKHCGTEFCEMHFCISCYDHVDYNMFLNRFLRLQTYPGYQAFASLFLHLRPFLPSYHALVHSFIAFSSDFSSSDRPSLNTL